MGEGSHCCDGEGLVVIQSNSISRFVISGSVDEAQGMVLAYRM